MVSKFFFLQNVTSFRTVIFILWFRQLAKFLENLKERNKLTQAYYKINEIK